MSEMAKAARAAMKEKAKRLGTTDPHQKVDASSWTPPEPLNTEAKTGLRPVSRRAFKKGGKVDGAVAKMHAGRKPRASGGEAAAYAKAKINRNVKDANEEREGVKHVGGMKKGGRAKKELGGPSGSGYEYYSMHTSPKVADEYIARQYAKENEPDVMSKAHDKEFERIQQYKKENKQMDLKRGGRAKKNNGGAGTANRVTTPEYRRELERRQNPPSSSAPQNAPLPPRRPSDLPRDRGMSAEEAQRFMDSRKRGGRTKKMNGGPMMPAMAPGYDPRMDIVKRQAMNFQGNPVTPGAKKGGKIERHPDEAMDKALIKKMVKKEARTGKAHGGQKRMNRKDGGMALDGEIQGTRPTGGRLARKSGGRAKGKTDINIIISAGEKAGGAPMMPPGMPRPVGGFAGMPPAPPPGNMPPPSPIAAPMPGPGPAMPPGPPMPPPGMGMPRKSGGRITPKAQSFADMKAGAGSGEGRLQKTDIAAYKRSKHRAGGKVYKSYADMDAGAGSGLGRLEKTEIQSRKH